MAGPCVLWGRKCKIEPCSPVPVFPVRYLCLGQFYQIWQNIRGSRAKIISFAWKIAKLSWKSIFFTHSHKICWANFSKCLSNFATYGLRGNTRQYRYLTSEQKLQHMLWHVDVAGNANIQWLSTNSGTSCACGIRPTNGIGKKLVCNLSTYSLHPVRKPLLYMPSYVPARKTSTHWDFPESKSTC